MAARSLGDELRLLTEAGLGRGMNVVEFGCGSGAVSRAVARTVGPAGRMLGLDDSAFSAARSRELALQEKLENTTYEVVDMGQTKVASNYADLCFARHLLSRVPRPENVVKEMVRVTRPGGVLAVFDTDDGLTVFEPEPPAVTEIRSLLAREHHAAGGNVRIGRLLHRLLAEAGLGGIRVVLLTANSTEPEWSPDRDPASTVTALGRGLDRLAEAGKVGPEDAARYRRTIEELTRNPMSFICTVSFFVYGRRPLRCA